MIYETPDVVTLMKNVLKLLNPQLAQSFTVQ